MQVGILKGIYANSTGDFVASYPINREPVILDTGLSKGYLRPAPGIAALGAGPGADRGGINWNGTCYRVMGSKLVSVASDGAVTVLGDVGAGGPVSLDYSFDRLGIGSNDDLFYWDTSTLTQVTDPDLGIVIDFLWVDGYFMTTDGENIVVTELNDPTSVDPLKYGSSEVNPDAVTGLMKVRGEVYALNRYTIELFTNVGGNGFPFQRNKGGMIPFGCVGPHAKAYYSQSFAFVGGALNEAVGVYLAGAGDAEKLSTKEIDDALSALSEAELAAVEVESRVDKDEQRLIIHLPTRSYTFHAMASAVAGEKIWTSLASGIAADQTYRGKHLVQAYGRWIVGDEDGNLGALDNAISSHFGTVTGWQFDTSLLYNEANMGTLHELELIGTPGHGPTGSDPRVFFSVTMDGETWGQERAASTGRPGDRAKRIAWRPHRRFSNWMGLRFRGADTGMASFARLEADIEALG